MISSRKYLHALFCVLCAIAIIIGVSFLGTSGTVHAEYIGVDDKPGIELTAEKSTITYDSEYCYGSTFVKVPLKFTEVSVADDSIARVFEYDPIGYHQYLDDNPLEYLLYDDARVCEIVPMEAGSTTITFKDEHGATYEATVNVQSEYFQAFLNRYKKYFGMQHYVISPLQEDYLFINTKLHYGRKTAQYFARYGVNVSLKIGGKTVKGTCDANNEADLSGIKTPLKLNTKGTVTLTFGSAKVTQSIKVGSSTQIETVFIKAKAKKGSMYAYNLHKGEVVKIKIGKKTVRTYKVKKDMKRKSVSFKTKKKLKKNTKIKYYVYNKYKQKLAYTTYKVGRDATDEEERSFYSD